jgi:hypothetical protein
MLATESRAFFDTQKYWRLIHAHFCFMPLYEFPLLSADLAAG